MCEDVIVEKQRVSGKSRTRAAIASFTARIAADLTEIALTIENPSCREQRGLEVVNDKLSGASLAKGADQSPLGIRNCRDFFLDSA